MTLAAGERPSRRIRSCPPEALAEFMLSLEAYAARAADAAQLKSAALKVWNCLDPLPEACADLVVVLSGDSNRPERFSQAARRILRAI